jgi:CO/xanthine dehydrogenase Mo-binding subunit
VPLVPVVAAIHNALEKRIYSLPMSPKALAALVAGG